MSEIIFTRVMRDTSEFEHSVQEYINPFAKVSPPTHDPPVLFDVMIVLTFCLGIATELAAVAWAIRWLMLL